MKDGKIWIIGTGNIGGEYAKILSELSVDFQAIGRSEQSAAAFEKELQEKGYPVKHPVIRGGLSQFLRSNPQPPAGAIVALPIESLQGAASELMDYGVQNILLEKPGFGYPGEIEDLIRRAKKTGSNVRIAFNRRFYSSVLEAENLIRQDGGVASFNFEFTEWSHVIAAAKHLKKVNLETLLVNNSSHVIDTAFFLGGQPREITCYHTGGLPWHPASSVFAGAGISESGALFSYSANWEAPGRWAIEILTKAHRLYLKPMESLQVQNIGSVAVNPVEIDDSLDKKFKPGFYLQAKAFVEGDYSRFCTVEEQKNHLENYYLKMSGYTF